MKIIPITIQASSIYLYVVGLYFILEDMFYPSYKLGPMPLGLALILAVGAAFPAIALFIVPHTKNYKNIFKVMIAIILAPPLIIFTANTYDCFLLLYQDRYREGFLYISTLTIGTISCLLGYYELMKRSVFER